MQNIFPIHYGAEIEVNIEIFIDYDKGFKNVVAMNQRWGIMKVQSRAIGKRDKAHSTLQMIVPPPAPHVLQKGKGRRRWGE